MHDSKDLGWNRDLGHKSRTGTAQRKSENTAAPAGTVGTNGDGWQQYRRWICKAPAPRTRRNGIDPSLYTWKGYRNWTEQVKRNWSDN